MSAVWLLFSGVPFCYSSTQTTCFHFQSILDNYLKKSFYLKYTHTHLLAQNSSNSVSEHILIA